MNLVGIIKGDTEYELETVPELNTDSLSLTLARDPQALEIYARAVLAGEMRSGDPERAVKAASKVLDSVKGAATAAVQVNINGLEIAKIP